MQMPLRPLAGLLALVLACAAPVSAQRTLYDPLALAPGFSASLVDLEVVDTDRTRTLPVRVYLPQSEAAAPVVVFSHGLGGSAMNNPYLGQHWAGRGFVVVFVQHPGSDEAVWKGKKPREILPAMTEAASTPNLLLRLDDIPALLDALEDWNAQADHPLAGRLDMDRVGMSGHSFGALTTQGLSGMSMRGVGQRYTDARIDAALAMSPSALRGSEPGAQFGSVAVPWMLMTGTDDTAPIGQQSVESRLAVFPALPVGDKYELVLDGAEHMAFSDAQTRRGAGKRNPNHHRVILALSTAFWECHLDVSDAACDWLGGEAPRTVMEPGDRWQTK